MTDNEIIKALEWCNQFENNIVFNGNGDEKCVQALQMMVVIKQALNEFNRQKAEVDELQHRNAELDIELKAMRGAANSYKAAVERLETETLILSQKRANIFEITQAYERGRAEAIKEFAERLKNSLFSVSKTTDGHYVHHISGDEIDNLVKEMVGAE